MKRLSPLFLHAAVLLAQNVPAPGGSFVFTEVQAFRWSDGRQAEIPAFSARLENRTGEDWEVARFRVTAHCGTGERAYDIALRNLDPEPRPVEFTAYDAIGALTACKPDSVSIAFLDGQPLAPERRSSYLVFGFTAENPDGTFQTALAGILDHRRPHDGLSTTRPIYWHDGGALLLELPGDPPRAFYAFRVDPGELGIAGFLESRAGSVPSSTGRFLRFIDIPPGKAVYAGTFLLRRDPSGAATLTLEPAPEFLARFPIVKGRPLVPGLLSKAGIQGAFTNGH